VYCRHERHIFVVGFVTRDLVVYQRTYTATLGPHVISLIYVNSILNYCTLYSLYPEMNSIFNISCSMSRKGSPVKSTFANSRTKNLFQVINGRVGKVSQRGPRRRVPVVSENSALVFGDATATAATIDDTVLKKREVQKRPLEINVLINTCDVCG
jgi:hypothetical protein